MSIYEHFRPEERPLIEHFLDLRDQAARRYQQRLTDFLDPREQQILKSLIGNDQEIHLQFSGGYSGAERCRALLYPVFDQPEANSFRLTCFDVQYPQKFTTLTHPELLGALMGTGVDRRKVGDLLFDENRAQFVCANEIEDYMMLNLVSVGKSRVRLIPIDPASIIHSDQNWQENEGTVSSLRLDTVLSEIYHLSRTKAAEKIDHGLVKVNWQPMSKHDYELAEGDVLSLRGSGRSKIISASSLTKKHKIRLHYGKLD
ncbi:MAG: YlmH/Sll1252 family protein [Sporolactobacillus sp.]